MKTILKSTLFIFAVAFFIAANPNFVKAQPGPITAPPGTSMIPSDYVDTTIADDPVYIFCSPDANGDTILGTLSVNGGATNCSFQWMIYNPATVSFENYGLAQTGATSLVNNLESGFYQALITQNPGLPNEAIYCRRAHVFVNNIIVDFDTIAGGCQPFYFSGSTVVALSDFEIFDPPPSLTVVDSTTEITVCFWAAHTFVSDLGFYLIGPGGNRIDLLPPVSAWDQGSQVTSLIIGDVLGCDSTDWYTNCNSGNHIDSFCFSSALPAGDPNSTPCICDMPTPLTGTFASCETWNDLYGETIPYGGWKVQIYDCTPADVGYLQKVTLSFNGSGQFGNPNFIYDSGPINMTINDNSFTPQTAATYTFPMILSVSQSHSITNEITAEWSCFPGTWNPQWGSTIYSINPLPAINPIPNQSTTFCLTVHDHLFDLLGNEITSTSYPQYVACEPQVCRQFENHQTDATILSYPGIICFDASPFQMVALNPGGTWSSSSAGNPPGPVDSNGVFTPSLALLGYNVVSYSFPGVCGDEQSVLVNVEDPLVVSNIMESCNGNNTHYELSLTIVGGNVGGYQILNCADSLPFPGTYFSPLWTSMWIPNGTPYCIAVSDGSSCAPSIISGTFDCNCNSSAGNMPTEVQELCEFDQTNIQALNDGCGNPTYNLDANDVFEYFLHDSQSNSLGIVFSHNTTGVFQFGPPLVYGETYYISQVVGNNIGTPSNPIVDINDPCTDVAEGTPVIWYQMPLAFAGQNDSVCGLTFQLNADTPTIGVGHWTCLTAPGIVCNPNFYDPHSIVTVPYFDTNQSGCLMNTDYILRWTVQNGPCEVYDDITVLFKPIPVAFAGDDNLICGLEAVLQAQWSNLCGPMGSSVGEWIGTGVITNPLSPVTNVNVFNHGTYTFLWSESNGECKDEDFVAITFLSQPTINAGYNDSIFGDTYYLNASSTMGVGWWEGPSGSIFSNPTSPQSTVQINFFGLSEVSGTFTWNEQNSICTVSDDVTIVFINTYSVTEPENLASDFHLYQNIPNPFTNETEISFYLGKGCMVEIEIYNLLGKQVSEILSGEMPKGKHMVNFQSKDLPAGTYYYRLKTPEFDQTRKMVWIK
ncbi:MAG: T9SS type A sorting domain-containing protein [Bacteroidales bacterium]|nr:T9SS type A sorting domain-containing protein [Bacteroidales bacterium]MCF8458722.1 T9SS type A sorting domain-containing protein [Bacteroidales bacterium]